MKNSYPLRCFLLALMPLHGAAMTAQDVYQAVAPSVWGVATFDESNRLIGRGSAVVIDSGQLVTNCHVLAKAKAVAVRKENVSYGAKLLHADVQRDLCLLKVDNFSATPVRVATISQTKIGTKAFAIGNPRGLEQTISEGLVSGIRRNDNDEIQFIQTSAPISPGSSGGGLFDDQGRLIGITTGGIEQSQNLNFAVPAEWISEVPSRAAAALAAREQARQPAARNSSGKGVLRPFEGDRIVNTGDWYSYRLTDFVASTSKTVAYVVDKVSDSEISYNNGTKIEDSDGRTTALTRYELGNFEILTPVDGWVVQSMKLGDSWESRFAPRVRNHPANLSAAAEAIKAKVVADTTIQTAVREFKVLRIDYEGWFGTPLARSRLTATGWWSPELKRFVVFESAFGLARERVELVKIERLSAN